MKIGEVVYWSSTQCQKHDTGYSMWQEEYDHWVQRGRIVSFDAELACVLPDGRGPIFLPLQSLFVSSEGASGDCSARNILMFGNRDGKWRGDPNHVSTIEPQDPQER